MEPKERKRDPREEELDRFWEIDALLPARRQVPRSMNTDAVEIDLPPISEAGKAAPSHREIPLPKRTETTANAPVKPSAAQNRVEASQKPTIPTETTVIHSVASAEEHPVRRAVSPIPRPEPPTPDDEYIPDSALLRRVRIYRWKSTYQYYEDFVNTAEKLLPLHGKPCPHVPFFSYVPQYSQLDRARLAWYLHFRDCVRRGEYPETDYSYILLLIYEIINLSDKIPPTEGRDLLLGLWRGYRKSFVPLDAYLPEWICDYSLIHHLPPPKDLDGHLLRRVMNGCRLREFYVCGTTEKGELRALLAFCSNYDYRKSKFCTEETSALFEETVFIVLRAVTERLSREGKLFSDTGMEDCTVTRDAYSGALCSYRMKRKIEVSYCSFSRSHELRFLITDVIKYTENKLRAHLGVRSRLSIYALPVSIREQIDALTAHLMPSRHTEQKRKEAEAEALYERLYDLPTAPLSLSNAAEIERASWETTEKLVEAFEEAAPADGNAPQMMPQQNDPPKSSQEASLPKKTALSNIEVPLPSAEPAAPSVTDLESTAVLSRFSAFLHAAMAEDKALQRSEASALGRLPDAIADEINELAADAIGDVLLEECDGIYSVIQDYREMIERILQNGT